MYLQTRRGQVNVTWSHTDSPHEIRRRAEADKRNRDAAATARQAAIQQTIAETQRLGAASIQGAPRRDGPRRQIEPSIDVRTQIGNRMAEQTASARKTVLMRAAVGHADEIEELRRSSWFMTGEQLHSGRFLSASEIQHQAVRLLKLGYDVPAEHVSVQPTGAAITDSWRAAFRRTQSRFH